MRLSFSILTVVIAVGCGRSSLEVEFEDAGPIPDGGRRDSGPDPDGGDPCRSDFECEDGFVCNGSERCIGGRCRSTGPLDCPAPPDPCLLSLCLEPFGCTLETNCTPDECRFRPECGGCRDFEFDCFNFVDDDCDGFLDCTDFDCSGIPECEMVCADIEFDCFNFRDDDCNGFLDCDDPVCRGAPGCPPDCFPEICNNKLDDDCDGLVDCGDRFDCEGFPPCDRCAERETRCADGIDEDCDRRFDCDDPDCFGSMLCFCEAFELSCSDMIDEDCDGFFDCDDGDCGLDPACRIPCTPRETSCTDMMDEDCDMRFDCDDPDCATAPPCVPPCPTGDLGSRIGMAVGSGTTVGAGNLNRGTCGGGTAGDRSFSWRAPSTGTFIFGLRRTNMTHDPLMYIRADSCAGPQLGCDDDAGAGNNSQITLTLMAGTRVVIFADGFGSNNGPFEIDITTMPVCAMTETACRDGVDEDCDIFLDCADPDCRTRPECCVPVPEICNDMVDNDCDRTVDCMDPSCAMNPLCVMPPPCPETDIGMRTGRAVATGTVAGAMNLHRGSCGGGGREKTFSWRAPSTGTFTFRLRPTSMGHDPLMYVRADTCTGMELACDDDRGGMLASMFNLAVTAGQRIVIFADTFGGSMGTFELDIEPACVPVAEVCTDTRDNDCDMLVDCADPDCRVGPEICNNMRDDDCDMAVDCRDTGCAMNPACLCTAGELGVAACTDRRDNDCDTRTDCADSDCSPFGPMGECCNGLDDDGDGQEDIFTCRCTTAEDCRGVGSLDQTCWTTTFSVCAPRCNFHGGDLFCQGLDPSLRCNAATGECIPR